MLIPQSWNNHVMNELSETKFIWNNIRFHLNSDCWTKKSAATRNSSVKRMRTRERASCWSDRSSDWRLIWWTSWRTRTSDWAPNRRPTATIWTRRSTPTSRRPPTSCSLTPPRDKRKIGDGSGVISKFKNPSLFWIKGFKEDCLVHNRVNNEKKVYIAIYTWRHSVVDMGFMFFSLFRWVGDVSDINMVKIKNICFNI